MQEQSENSTTTLTEIITISKGLKASCTCIGRIVLMFRSMIFSHWIVARSTWLFLCISSFLLYSHFRL